MDKSKNLIFRAVAICTLSSFVAAVSAQDIRWGGVVNPGGGSERENVLHAPDHRYTALDPALTVSHFTPSPGPARGVLNTAGAVYPTTMHYTGLAALLGISEKILARADVIAFEGNGGYGPSLTVGWESSEWTFSAGTSTRRVSFHTLMDGTPSPGGDPTMIATGTITSTAYSRFFGMCSPDLDSPGISYILFDLHSTAPAIDVSRPDFSVTVGNGTGGEASPDVDAIGVLVACRSK